MLVSIPLLGAVESLNVSVAAAVLLYEARRQRRRWLTRRLYLFDGYNLLHAGPFADRRELVDALASFVATTGARGVVVFDGVGDDAERGAARRSASRRTPTRCSSGSRPSTASASACCSSRSDATVLETAGREVANLSVADVLPRLRPAERPRTNRRAVSPAGSTRRLANASNDYAEASKRVLCK